MDQDDLFDETTRESLGGRDDRPRRSSPVDDEGDRVRSDFVERQAAAVAANLERHRKYAQGILTLDDLPEPSSVPDDLGPPPSVFDVPAMIEWNRRAELWRVWRQAVADREWLAADLIRQADERAK